MDQNCDIDAWRRVHRKLTLALIQSRDNIAAELTQRRYILEEMNRCKMQNTQKSAPGSSSGSKSKKKVIPKKAAAPKKEKASAATGKVRKISPSTSTMILPSKTNKPKKPKPQVQPKPMGHNLDRLVNESMVASAVAPPVMGVGGEGSLDDHSERIDSEGGETLHPPQFAGITPHQIRQLYYPPGPYSAYGNVGMGMATPEQMNLAFQMMQQINQNATGDEETSGHSEEGTKSVF